MDDSPDRSLKPKGDEANDAGTTGNSKLPEDVQHLRYLQAADPLFHFAESNGLFPDDYQLILDSLEDAHHETSGPSSGADQPADPGAPLLPEFKSAGEIGPDPESADPGPEEKAGAGKQQNTGGVASDPEGRVSPYVQWLNRLAQPVVPGDSPGRRTRKEDTEKEAQSGQPREVEEQKVQTQESEPVVDLDTPARQATRPARRKGKKDHGVQLSPDVISETLAEVLASQGHIHAAMEMYEKLSLIYPEKKALFAVKIENLKKE